MQNKLQIRYLPFLALAILALLFALWAGLLRLGWTLPAFSRLAMAHGPLMVSGFLGVLIPLERAVAIRQKWMFAVPIVAGLGWLGLFIQPFLGGLLMTLGSLGMLGILVVMVRREPHIHTVTMAFGALAWLVGNILWITGRPISQIVFWWISFLVLTIGGERLELNRVLHPSKGQIRLFSLFATSLLAGSILALFALVLGARLSGLSMLALALWFLKNDLATRNIRHPNALTRYIAICLLGGFIWLGLGGGLYLFYGTLVAGPLYDAALHSIFVGFVITMIFGHAPIIFPSILGVPISFSPLFYFHLTLLHLSLIVRVVGDLTNLIPSRRWGGLLNVVAILLFLALTIHSIVVRKKQE